MKKENKVEVTFYGVPSISSPSGMMYTAVQKGNMKVGGGRGTTMEEALVNLIPKIKK